MKNERFDSKEELFKLSLERLLFLQKMELNNLSCYICNDNMYDKNYIYNRLQELLIINLVLQKKNAKIKH